MNVRVHSDGVRGVAGCARSLNFNNLGEAAGQAIGAGLQHTPQLQELGLSRNNLGEAGGQAIGAGLQHTPQLQTLE